MNNSSFIEIRIGRGALIMMTVSLALMLVFFVLPEKLQAQKAQEGFKEKFNVADSNGGVGVATSSDGKFVYVIGPEGIMVSDDFGKTGSWVQTVRLK